VRDGVRGYKGERRGYRIQGRDKVEQDTKAERRLRK